MKRAVTRVGDKCTGHDDCPSVPLIEGDPTVLVNGKPIAVIGSKYQNHSGSNTKDHTPHIITGSSHVFVHGKPVARIGDLVSCGATVAEGSCNVFIGDDEIHDNRYGAIHVKDKFFDESSEIDRTILSMPEICESMANKTEDKKDKQGWIYLKQMFEKWLTGNALSIETSKLDYKKAKILSFNWFNRFDRFVDVKQELIDNCLNEKGQTSLIKVLKENGYFDAPREFDFINVSYKERDKYYFNQRSVDELDLSLHPIDGLSIAMGAFVINATAKGKVEKKSDGGYLITVDQIGLYAKDMFNFAGANNLYLFWSYKDKDFSTNGIAGTLDDNYHWLTNEDFNLFRKNTNNGEDFLIFSEVEKQSLSAKIHNK